MSILSDSRADLEMNNPYRSIESIAIVGDGKWKNDVLDFSLAGMRKATVRFVEKEVEALSWLER